MRFISAISQVHQIRGSRALALIGFIVLVVRRSLRIPGDDTLCKRLFCPLRLI